MTLLTLSNAHLAFGHRALLDGTSLSLAAGERVALIGRNGEGKSSLLKILAGLEKQDDGELQLLSGLTRAYVPQEPIFVPGISVFDAVSEGVQEAKALRERFERHDENDDMDAVQTRLEAVDGWDWERRVDDVVMRLRLDGAVPVESLSGGTKKRVALAQALVAAPQLLLLDEPTNHLDVEAIEWLQDLLVQRRGALIFVSHDRAFIDAVTTRIVELDRGQLRSYPGSFATYESTKARELEDQALANARADKLLAQEEVWVRQGVEARRTRSVGRIGRLVKLREQRAARRDQMGRVRLGVDSGIPPGKIVAELENVSKGFDGRTLIEGFTATILRGDKVGLIGPNGVGKTTLLRLILGELEADSGKIKRGTRLQVAYFDQMRAGLDLDATLADTISPGSEWIETGAKRQHVMSYLNDFLFSPERARSPVSTLSGGERNRVLLARLFALPANVLVLDEPTNDLDIDTLELLEDLLQQYQGTVFLVSHDRRFLDNVVTSTIAWEGDPAFGGKPGLWREYEGGYEDWKVQRARAKRAAASAPAAAAAGAAGRSTAASSTGIGSAVSAVSAATTAAATAAKPKIKLSYKDQREFEALPARIAALEGEQSTISTQLADGSLYAREPQRAADLSVRHAKIDDELLLCLERWEALGGT